MFTLEDWPQLSEFRKERFDKKITEKLYGGFDRDNMASLIPQLIQAYAKGGLDSIERNLRSYLTKFDGDLCPSSWTTERIAETQGFVKTNIQMAESPFAILDYYSQHLGSTTSVSTLCRVLLPRRLIMVHFWFLFPNQDQYEKEKRLPLRNLSH